MIGIGTSESSSSSKSTAAGCLLSGVNGRDREAFKTSKDKFIVPTRLEDHFGRSLILAQFCVMGHGFDQPVLLTTLSETCTTLDKETVNTELQALLDEVNAEVPAYERVRQIYVTSEWTIENTLLTPTMKLKRERNQIEQTYRDRIEQSLSGDRVISL